MVQLRESSPEDDLTASARDPQTVDPAFERDRFLLRQQVLTINQKYEVWDEQGQAILFVERPAHFLQNLGAAIGGLLAGGVIGVICFLVLRLAFGPDPQSMGLLVFAAGLSLLLCGAAMVAAGTLLSAKRHVTFYRDASRSERMLEIKQDRKLMLVRQHFTVLDSEGRTIGLFTKNTFSDILRKRWVCSGPRGQIVCVAKEEFWHALLSRTLGKLFPMNFIFYRGDGADQIGQFSRRFTLLDRYVLDVSGDRSRAVDRRLVLALGVMLDTGERR